MSFHIYTKPPGCHSSPSQKNPIAVSQPANSFVCIYLPPLALSLRSFSRSHPLFSAIYGLFLQNTGGGGGSLLAFTLPDATLPASHLSRPAATMNFMRLKNLCIVLLCLLPAATSAQTADEILAKVIAARGGLDKLRAVRSERISGTISFGEVSGPFVVELKRPLKMHMQLTIQNQTMVRVYDGKQGWANNPFAGKVDPEAMSGDELKNITEESDFDGPLLDYKSKGNQIELVGKDKVDDKDVWRLKLTTKNGDARFYLFAAN